MNNTRSQNYTLNTKDISAVLNIEPYNKTDSIINATIMITNHRSDTIYLPIMKSMDNIDYFFFLREKSLYFYAGIREFFFGINEPGLVKLKILPPNRTENIAISIKSTHWNKIELIEIDKIVFRVEYLQNINPNIIWELDGKTTMRGSDYLKLFQVLRSSFKLHCK
jgi:hypothetical protein